MRGERRILAPHRRTYILSHPHPHTRKHTQTPAPTHIVTFVVFNIITLCRSASLYCCARFLVPPFWSTCLCSANLYCCAICKTKIVSETYDTQLLRLRIIINGVSYIQNWGHGSDLATVGVLKEKGIFGPAQKEPSFSKTCSKETPGQPGGVRRISPDSSHFLKITPSALRKRFRVRVRRTNSGNL